MYLMLSGWRGTSCIESLPIVYNTHLFDYRAYFPMNLFDILKEHNNDLAKDLSHYLQELKLSIEIDFEVTDLASTSINPIEDH